MVRVSEATVASRKRSELEEGRCGFYMRMEITARYESDRTASVQRLLQFNGHDLMAVDGLHLATVIKDHGPDLGGKPQILDRFCQNYLSLARTFDVVKDTR